MPLTGRLPWSSVRRWWRAALVPLLALGLSALLLAGCGLFGPEPDPYAEIRASWRDGYAVPDAELDAMPFYSITARIDAPQGRYTGTLDLRLPVSSTSPLRDLYFRIFPRLLVFDGDLQLSGAWVNGKTVSFTQAAEGTALQLNVVTPLENGMPAQVRMLFHGEMPMDRKDGVYTIFGQSEQVLSLTNFYPILASRRGGEWALDLPHPQGDVGFASASLYRVTLTVPPGQTIVATGTEITRTMEADGWQTVRYAIGPAREFTALLSPALRLIEGESLGTRVKSYYYAADAEIAHQALRDGMAALQVFSDAFGPYPYKEMSIVEAPLTYHGMEFPGVSLIGSQVYSKYQGELENLVVHEIAHQWWYNQVGSDQVRTPWLDEGLAEYSMYTYYKGRYGQDTADGLAALRWEFPVSSLQKRGKDRPIGLPVVDYKENYETLVYGKGALFFRALADRLGPLKFDRLLREYVSRYRWKIATEADFRALAEEMAGEDLGPLFEEWLRD